MADSRINVPYNIPQTAKYRTLDNIHKEKE